MAPLGIVPWPLELRPRRKTIVGSMRKQYVGRIKADKQGKSGTDFRLQGTQ